MTNETRFAQYEIFVPGDPAPKYGDKQHSFTAVGAEAWRDTLELCLARGTADWRMREAIPHMPWRDHAAVAVEAVLFFRRPKSVSRLRPSVTPDIDKLERMILDAGTGLVYQDDGQVVHIDTRLFYSDGEFIPGAALRFTYIHPHDSPYGLPLWAAAPQRLRSLDALPEQNAWG